MTPDELKRILADHALWLTGNAGKCANLRGADLSRANLRGANLSRANLRWADLSGADLSRATLSEADLSQANLCESTGLCYAQCSFDAHGERGRQLSGVVIAEELWLFCGCFAGTLAELDVYIDKCEERYKRTRKLARDFIVAAIAARKEQP